MIVFSLGTRPSIIKMATVILEARQRKNLEYSIVHTGQHYDWEMSKSFFEELDLPEPDYLLGVKSGSHGIQTSKVIARFEKVLSKEKPLIVVVDGDTNSAMGSCIAASKLKIPIGHIEAGCRSFDKSMPEEINRIVIADLANIHFAPTKNCVSNLLREGIHKKEVFLTGHPLVDLLYGMRNKIDNASILKKNNLKHREFYCVTLHRDFNTDNKARLKEILKALAEISKYRLVVFPIHPRTKKMIRSFGLENFLANIMTMKPIGYLEMLSLIKNARVVLTDSGGIQQECPLLGTPCITLRENTEWIETLSDNMNQLVGASHRKIVNTTLKLDKKYDLLLARLRKHKNLFGNVGASERIVNIIANFVKN